MNSDIKWLPLSNFLINNNIYGKIITRTQYQYTSSIMSPIELHGELKLYTEEPANEQQDLVFNILTDFIYQLSILKNPMIFDLKKYSYNSTMKYWEFEYTIL